MENSLGKSRNRSYKDGLQQGYFHCKIKSEAMNEIINQNFDDEIRSEEMAKAKKHDEEKVTENQQDNETSNATNEESVSKKMKKIKIIRKLNK